MKPPEPTCGGAYGGKDDAIFIAGAIGICAKEEEPKAELRITVKPNRLGLLSDSLLQWRVNPTRTSLSSKKAVPASKPFSEPIKSVYPLR